MWGGGQKLYHDRWENVLPKLTAGSIDLLVTDPPYAITNLKWDQAVNWEMFWNEAKRVCKVSAWIILFAAGKFTIACANTNIAEFRYELIWEKSCPVGFLDANRRPLRSHEHILIFNRAPLKGTYNPQLIKGRSHDRGAGQTQIYRHFSRTPRRKSDQYHPRSILKFPSYRNPRFKHPTAKPPDLLAWLIRSYSNPGDTILDPFAGIGTSLVAAKETGRDALGCEIETDYVRMAQERLRA